MFFYKFGMSPSLWALAAGAAGAWWYFKKRKK
jgi:LPXTG-motif cell wall-anchored protein